MGAVWAKTKCPGPMNTVQGQSAKGFTEGLVRQSSFSPGNKNRPGAAL